MFNFIMAFISFFILRSGVHSDPDSAEMRRVSVELDRWHSEHRDLKFLIISDLHFRRENFQNGSAERLLNRINSADADIIILLGDYIYLPKLDPGGRWRTQAGENTSLKELALFFRRLKARHGVYAICGNHEERFGKTMFIQQMERSGFPKFLDGKIVPVQVNGKTFYLASPDPEQLSYRQLQSFLRAVPGDAPVILLCHSPVWFPEIPERVELALAGHTHSGQINMPFFHGISGEKPYYQLYQHGLFRHRRSRLLVSSGAGNSNVNLRIGAAPELLLLNLKGKSKKCASTEFERMLYSNCDELTQLTCDIMARK